MKQRKQHTKLYISTAFVVILAALLALLPLGKKQAQEPMVEVLAPMDTLVTATVQPLSPTAQYLDSLGYINITEQDKNIFVSLMYARDDNFMGKVLYDDLREAYLHPDAISPLLKAQQLLQQAHPDYHLMIFDAARPMYIQQQMWDVVKGTRQQNYVSNPAHGGGLHNYGLAVDVSIANTQGDTIPMGTIVDHLGREAHTDFTAISAEALQNRRLLIRVMREAGFRSLPSEWWHFNLASRQVARDKYKVIP